MKVYDTHFNGNEWFVIIGLCIGYLVLFILPKRFSLKVTLVFVICGIYSGFFYDHSLSIEPIGFYDVNDTSKYQFIDFLSYLMYGPWSYLFFYVWDYFHVQFRWAPVYIFIWSLFSSGLEKLAVLFNVYHYLKGYGIEYSFSIYLLTLSMWSALFYYYKVKQSNNERKV